MPVAWFHAGAETAGTTRWSPRSRRTVEAATAEARRMARADGGRPVVESWAGAHGPRPSDADAVDAAWYVD